MFTCIIILCRSDWSTSWPYQNDNFRTIMSSHCFELLLNFLHLNDSRKQPAWGEPGYDKLYKVCPLLDAAVKNFQSCYTPTENLPTDESMIGFKGRLAFLQYMPKVGDKGVGTGRCCKWVHLELKAVHRERRQHTCFQSWSGTSGGDGSS